MLLNTSHKRRWFPHHKGHSPRERVAFTPGAARSAHRLITASIDEADAEVWGRNESPGWFPAPAEPPGLSCTRSLVHGPIWLAWVAAVRSV